MSPRATKSTFGSIHLTLALIALSVMAGICVLTQAFVAPRLVETRAENILSIIRSHQEDIVLNRPRAVREELIRSKAIAEDQQFSHYFSDEKTKVLPLLKGCQFQSPSFCLGPKSAVFFVSNSDQPPQDSFKFAIVLENDLTRPSALLWLWEGVACLLIAAAFWALHRAILRKEKYLLERLAVAGSAFTRARGIFKEQQEGADEFDSFGKSAEELVRSLENYKAQFERKTRLEQLGLTIGQISHDLKAPFNETKHFLRSLPLLLDTMPRAKIEAAAASLVARVESGEECLNQALQITKQAATARDELLLHSVLQSVTSRAKENIKLKKLFFTLSAAEGIKTLGDSLRLETALLNLIENTSDERFDAHIRIDLSHGENGQAKILYEDNGGGIPEEFLGTIFDPLVTYKANGTGLGLSSTKEIISQHRGSIRAIPNKGGAKFEIYLPILGGAHA